MNATTDVVQLAERVEKLERRSRRLLRFCLLSTISLCALVTMGANTAGKTFGDVQVRSLRVLDSDGKATLAITSQGVGFSDLALDGELTPSFMVQKKGLVWFDETGATIAFLDRDGLVFINGQASASLGREGLEFRGPSEKLLLQAGLVSEGQGASGFVDVYHTGRNQAVAQLFTDSDGGKLYIGNSKGQDAVDVYVDANGAGKVQRWGARNRKP